MSVTVIRASSLAGYTDCPRRGAARMFRREIERSGYTLRRLTRSIGALVGSAVHRGAAVELTEKAKTGRLPPVSVALDAGRDQLTEDLKTGEVMFDSAHGPTHNTRDAGAQCAQMSHSYHAVIAPTIQPVLVERRLEAEIEGGIVLSGQSDVVAYEPGSIRDLKTGQRPPQAIPQIGAYSLLSRSHGYDVTEAAIDFVRRVSPKKPQPEPMTIHAEIAHAETAAVSILRHIASDIKTFREGDPERRIRPGDSWSFLANPSSMLCGEKWCPCWGITGPHSFCHEWQPKG